MIAKNSFSSEYESSSIIQKTSRRAESKRSKISKDE